MTSGGIGVARGIEDDAQNGESRPHLWGGELSFQTFWSRRSMTIIPYATVRHTV